MPTVTFNLMDLAFIVAIIAGVVHIERRFGNLEAEAEIIKAQLALIVDALGLKPTVPLRSRLEDHSGD